MQPSLAPVLPSGPEWIFEPKWDGYRAFMFDGKLFSKRGNELTKKFPELTFDKDAMLDGEIIALDETGYPQFKDLRSKNRVVVYYAFDLLFLNGEDLRALPLTKRKQMLKKLIPKRGRINYTDHFTNGLQLFQEMERLGLEGIVAKKKSSLYVSGKTKEWLKVKTRAGKAEMKVRSEMWGH